MGAGLLKSNNVLEAPRTLWNYTAPLGPPPDFAVIGWRRTQALAFFFSPGNARWQNIPGGSDSKASAYYTGDLVWSLGWEDPLEKEMATHCSSVAWKSQGQRSLVGYSPWGRKESDTTWVTSLSLLGNTNVMPVFRAWAAGRPGRVGETRQGSGADCRCILFCPLQCGLHLLGKRQSQWQGLSNDGRGWIYKVEKALWLQCESRGDQWGQGGGRLESLGVIRETL